MGCNGSKQEADAISDAISPSGAPPPSFAQARKCQKLSTSFAKSVAGRAEVNRVGHKAAESTIPMQTMPKGGGKHDTIAGAGKFSASEPDVAIAHEPAAFEAEVGKSPTPFPVATRAGYSPDECASDDSSDFSVVDDGNVPSPAWATTTGVLTQPAPGTPKLPAAAKPLSGPKKALSQPAPGMPKLPAAAKLVDSPAAPRRGLKHTCARAAGEDAIAGATSAGAAVLGQHGAPAQGANGMLLGPLKRTRNVRVPAAVYAIEQRLSPRGTKGSPCGRNRGTKAVECAPTATHSESMAMAGSAPATPVGGRRTSIAAGEGAIAGATSAGAAVPGHDGTPAVFARDTHSPSALRAQPVAGGDTGPRARRRSITARHASCSHSLPVEAPSTSTQGANGVRLSPLKRTRSMQGQTTIGTSSRQGAEAGQTGKKFKSSPSGQNTVTVDATHAMRLNCPERVPVGHDVPAAVAVPVGHDVPAAVAVPVGHDVPAAVAVPVGDDASVAEHEAVGSVAPYNTKGHDTLIKLSQASTLLVPLVDPAGAPKGSNADLEPRRQSASVYSTPFTHGPVRRKASLIDTSQVGKGPRRRQLSLRVAASQDGPLRRTRVAHA